MDGPQAKTPWTSLRVETARRPWDNGPQGHGRAERPRKRRTFHPRHSVPPPMLSAPKVAGTCEIGWLRKTVREIAQFSCNLTQSLLWACQFPANSTSATSCGQPQRTCALQRIAIGRLLVCGGSAGPTSPKTTSLPTPSYNMRSAQEMTDAEHRAFRFAQSAPRLR